MILATWQQGGSAEFIHVSRLRGRVFDVGIRPVYKLRFGGSVYSDSDHLRNEMFVISFGYKWIP